MSRLKMKIPKRPTMELEKQWSAQYGGCLVAGVDEAGRGPLAGPVVAAAVILDPTKPKPRGINDSKKLNLADRERLFSVIQRDAVAFGVGIATAQEVDLLNILEATRLAARRALALLAPQPTVLLTDCLEIPGEDRPLLPIVKGDAISASIAAASVLAKVTRDRLMDDYAREFPEFGWSSNRGYPTADHYAAIGVHGATTLHRLTFAGVSFFETEARCSPTCERLVAAIHEAKKSTASGAIEALRSEYELVKHRLPPPDCQKLEALLGRPINTPSGS